MRNNCGTYRICIDVSLILLFKMHYSNVHPNLISPVERSVWHGPSSTIIIYVS